MWTCNLSLCQVAKSSLEEIQSYAQTSHYHACGNQGAHDIKELWSIYMDA